MGADAIRLQATLVLRDFLDQTAKSEGGEFKTPYFVTEVMGAGSDSCLPFSEFVEIGALDVMAISQVRAQAVAIDDRNPQAASFSLQG